MKILALVAVFLLIPSVEAAVISEIMYDLEGKDAKREWIEIQNPDSEIDISGWRLHEANTNHRLRLVQGSFLLEQGAFAVIADNNQSFLKDNPDFSGTLIDSSFSLSNSGEELSLKDSDGNVLDVVSYSSGQGANGDGKSLQLIDDEWLACEPTPGERNHCEARSEDAETMNNPDESEVEEKISKLEPAVEVKELVETKDAEKTKPEQQKEGVSEPLTEMTGAVVAESKSQQSEAEVVYQSDKQGNLLLPLMLLLFISLFINVLLIISKR